jgi:hypothetical protein
MQSTLTNDAHIRLQISGESRRPVLKRANPKNYWSNGKHTTRHATHGRYVQNRRKSRAIYTGCSEDYKPALLLLIAVQYKQILVVN